MVVNFLLIKTDDLTLSGIHLCEQGQCSLRHADKILWLLFDPLHVSGSHRWTWLPAQASGMCTGDELPAQVSELYDGSTRFVYVQ